MGYERTPRDRYRDADEMDYGRDYGTGRDYSYSSARDYASAGWRDREDNGRFDNDRYQERGGGYRREGRFDQRPYGGYGGGTYGSGSRDYGSGDNGRFGDYGSGRGPTQGYRQSWGRGLGYRDQDRDRDYGQNRGHGRGAPQGYDYEDRGFFARAGDEVRSWFGDDEAERRREFDQRYDERYGSESDRDYHEWRRGQIASLDRDYDEYRREKGTKFHNEFGSWRNERQTQRSSLERVNEHMEVVGSDGQHVGTVDKVRGDRIVLTKNDQDADGHHHSIPSRWIQSVDDKVTIRKTADEAHREWKDEERRTALFSDERGERESGPHMLNRSFSGTYRS